jgi:hypothetical protein
MGEKRVVLKDEPYPAPMWRNVINRLASHYDFAARDALEACEHHERRGLARPGGPKKSDELSAPYREI